MKKMTKLVMMFLLLFSISFPQESLGMKRRIFDRLKEAIIYVVRTPRNVIDLDTYLDTYDDDDEDAFQQGQEVVLADDAPKKPTKRAPREYRKHCFVR